MAINDPLFSTTPHEPSRPWWGHPAVWVLALVLVAGLLAWLTGKRPEDRPPQEIEIEFEVIYDGPDAGESEKMRDAADQGS